MIKVKHIRKELHRRRIVENMLLTFKSSFVIVEGKHDINALKQLGISAHTYESVMRSVYVPKEKVVILMDLDRRGIEKAELASNALSSVNLPVDITTGRSFLKMLNTVHVEGVLAPIEQLFEM